MKEATPTNAAHDEPGIRYSLEDLLRVMQRLRDPEGGCPWDLQQTMASIVPSTLEECYELADAIERDDMPHVAEELGDVLFQVVFYSQLGSEQDLFDFASVTHVLVDKLVRRHPHVFAGGNIEGRVEDSVSPEEVKVSWEAIKAEERAAKQRAGVLDDVPTALPAMVRAQKLQKRAAGVGFDWERVSDVLDNLEHEIAELRTALSSGNAQHVEDEFGDVLFSAVNVGRHLKLDCEKTLRAGNNKFEKRFRDMEARLASEAISLDSVDAEQWDKRWHDAKSRD